MDPGSKVTFNGVADRPGGHRRNPSSATAPRRPSCSLDVDPRYIDLIPANVDAKIQATTVFGNKYVSFTSPDEPGQGAYLARRRDRGVRCDNRIQHAVRDHHLDLGEGGPGQAEPDAVGDRGGADRAWATSSASRSSTATRSSTTSTRRCRSSGTTSRGWRTCPTSTPTPRPDLWNSLDNAVTTARTFNQQQNERRCGAAGGGRLRQHRRPTCSSAAGRTWCAVPPTWCPPPNCSTPTARSCSAPCATTPRPAARGRRSLGGNGYSLHTTTTLLGAENPYVYPDNLPRVNARGGPGGAPGCWQPINRDLWPAPYLVMDTGASIAPYNHLELGQPILTEYVWGRQVGENTINP